jgi:hypothetical protein
MFSCRGQGFEAEMAISPAGEFVVRRGSRARLRTTPTVPRGTVALWESLIDKGVLREDNGTLIFLQRLYLLISIRSSGSGYWRKRK